MKPSINIFISLVALLTAVVGQAQTDNPDGIGVVTGSSTGTYIKFGLDMATAAKSEQLNLIVKESEGSLANIRRLVSKENAALGIVQSDVLGFLTRSQDKNMQRVANRLRLVFPFYNEEVHLYANREIQTFADLQGKRVVVGTKGSGNWLTSTNLLHLMGVEAGEQLNIDPAAGATAVLTGKADAMFYVAGKPVKLFSNIEQLKNNPKYEELVKQVHMVPLNDEKMLGEYASAELTPSDYNWMNETVPTIAVKAVLVSFDFSYKDSPYYKTRCGQLKRLGNAIYSSINELRDSGHPKWNEVNLDEEIGLWKRDKCSAVSVTARNSSSQTTANDDFLTKELEKCIRTGTCQ